MNSLAELNTFNATYPLNYTDERLAQIVFDRFTPINQNVYVANDGDHTLPLGIDIQDIVQGESLNIRLEVDLTGLPDTDVDWGTIPSGLFETVVGRVYTLNGIATLEEWLQIKQPTITGSVLNYGDYVYASAIKYQTTGNKSWTITIHISSSATLPADFVLYNNPIKFRPTHGSSDLTVDTIINPVPAIAIDNSVLLSCGTALYARWTANIELYSNYSLSLTPLASDYLINNTRSGDTYSTNTATVISGGPLINNDYFGYTTETMKILPLDINAVLDIVYYTESRKQANDSTANSSFGQSVSLSSDGNTIAIGSPGSTVSGVGNAGAVYIFTRSGSTWSQQAKVYASDPGSSDNFGRSVSLSSDGNTLAVGSYRDDNSGGADAGSVYIFVRSGTTWTQETRLQANDASNFGIFGKSVSLSSDGNTLAVGSPYSTFAGVIGKVYIFVRSGTTWSQQARLQGSDTATDDLFGWSVSLSSDGNNLAIGSTNDNNSGGTDAGSVYVFTRSGSTWSQQARLQASDAAPGDNFGQSVSLSSDGNNLAIGSYQDDNSGGTDAGSVYVFTKSGSTWSQQARLQASDATTNDGFAYEISISSDGNKLAVGSFQDDNSGGSNAGSVYIFVRYGTTWLQQSRLQASDAVIDDNFGSSVSISSDGNTTIIGSPSDDNSGGSNAGSIYIFTKLPLDDVTKTLTLTGTKTEINTQIDNLFLIPATGYTSNFTLQYRYLNPDDPTRYVYRDQTITHV